jgi:transposase
MQPSERLLPYSKTRELRALLARRRQLVEMITAETNRRTHALELVRQGIAVTIRCLKRQVASWTVSLLRLSNKCQRGDARRNCCALLPVSAR